MTLKKHVSMGHYNFISRNDDINDSNNRKITILSTAKTKQKQEKDQSQ